MLPTERGSPIPPFRRILFQIPSYRLKENHNIDTKIVFEIWDFCPKFPKFWLFYANSEIPTDFCKILKFRTENAQFSVSDRGHNFRNSVRFFVQYHHSGRKKARVCSSANRERPPPDRIKIEKLYLVKKINLWNN